uniref:NAD(P)-binding protein n=1 Tax=Moniliophthora roreri TaxID=221103 RepID=A0A0W0EYN9_MONRR
MNEATHIPDEHLFEHASRLKGKVVLITGAANGIGKETATQIASYGGKVIIADRDFPAAEKTVQEIRNAGGTAFALKCDVTVWDDVVAMYEFAIDNFGVVDVVIPNAGVGEIERFDVKLDSNNKPKQLAYKTIQVNLIGALNTVQLAQHYLLKNYQDGDLKGVVVLGSIASWLPIPGAPQYAASKHAMLGVMRALHPLYTQYGIRISSIHPFFANTDIVPLPAKIGMVGIPFTPVPRIAGAIIYAITHPDPATSGCAYMLLDDGPVFKIPKEEFKLGIYKLVDERSNALVKAVGLMVLLRRRAGKIIRTILSLAAIYVAWSWYRAGKKFWR